ncbi:Chain length determinant protein [Pirellulimonas nuda]|uniref:Chain length determinant protein n=1 Tax=Pirellulimonas nuda TaxID=2528009 RepID=A0A518D7I4_9BACT|nr:Wzz/FepE/Etk N-terminal domain-containing protein [Pirellulimonas nuda]QDU87444.1 Chain length determinant protein [Pirellulimonas nuda]
MPPQPEAGLSPREVVRLLQEHWRVWALPALAGLLLAGAYAALSTRQWKATQGLLVRSEAAGFAEQRLGKFTDLAEMKTLQETVLEVARSQSVVEATLKEVGPPPSRFGGWFGNRDWPTAQDVADFRDDLRLTPPGGAEFGKTEIFYISVLNKNVERAQKLVDALATQLEDRMQQLRNQRAESMVAELRQGVEIGTQRLDAQTQELSRFEAGLGADLSDLRSLVSPIGGPGEMGQRALAIEGELRQHDGERQRLEQLLATVRAAESDPNLLLATPAELLASQPALQRLKDGLVDARIAVARLSGARSASHPLVRAAQETERGVAVQLREELPAAVAGIELQLRNNAARIKTLTAKLSDVHGRAGSIARHRSEYSELIAAVDHQTRLVDASRKQLSDAEALRAGAGSASVLERIDQVEAGIRPVGPGRVTIAAAGGLGGLVLGLSVLFVFYTTPAPGAAPPAVRTATPRMTAADYDYASRPAVTPMPYDTHEAFGYSTYAGTASPR